MNGLSLCSGIGGLDLALAAVWPEYRTACYVEIDPFCQEILLRRADDGWLARAPIWPDLRTFDGRSWRGIVDCLTAGFPCQPFSTAGKRKGAADVRNLWPDVQRVIGESEPAVVVLENVPGSLPYFYHVVLPGLQSMGYAASAGLFTAAEVGAPHRRQRLFVLGRSDRSVGPPRPRVFAIQSEPSSQGVQGERSRQSEGVDDSGPAGLQGRGEPERSGFDELPPWPPGPTERDRWAAILARWPDLAPPVEEVAPEPTLRGMADGTAPRIHRLRALVNAVVPAQAILAIRA